MALYIVHEKNPYRIKHGTFMESFGNECIKAEIRMEGNRAVVNRNVGLWIPLSEMRPFMMRVQRSGVDK